jgi:hypothetical protein
MKGAPFFIIFCGWQIHPGFAFIGKTDSNPPLSPFTKWGITGG